MKSDKTSIFWDLEESFVERVMYVASKEHLQGDRVIFRQGDPASRAYFLIRGTVRLTIGEEGRLVYTVKKPGEFIGWSSLTGGDVYSATATTVGNTRLLSISREDLYEAMEKYPASGMIIYERLAAILGTRLIRIYQSISSSYGDFPLPVDREQPLAFIDAEA
ncbi:MAG: cyclic nucleotide-binding domain-containing protein [Desulfatibacillum sp.]|nr:cyclic nucleotide-binding domain-containing protein [Desulfatibacillum sp.]